MNKNLPLISVIIPCFNSGEFLMSAIDSVQNNSSAYNFEVIIINDGSTDQYTLDLLKELSAKSYKVINQENKGAANARNKGVKSASGKYLLMLDSDNRIYPDFIARSIKKLEASEKIGVAYGNVNFIGDVSHKRMFIIREFDPHILMLHNFIDMCAVIRKKTWDELNGLDEGLVALEDWELWLRVYKAGWEFCYIDEVAFDYRVRNNSLMDQNNDFKSKEHLLKYIHGKHMDILLKNYESLLECYYSYNVQKNSPFKYFLKNVYFKYFKF
ncbi:glycosyltransferase [Mucilaginibacter sp. CSA2-8R]|uniref:glycosyltransferase family 2 protein n=1 Tax=Mucilaginibacter sp. CSA2-8R TaxID=3141542 RepID=UPI00315DD87C